jgi:two-component system cell cycle sensor histidine kinase/response regulator CckA
MKILQHDESSMTHDSPDTPPRWQLDQPAKEPRTLQLLHAEDEPDDALLCQLQLKEAGLRIDFDVVASKEEFLEALQTKLYDIVLTDYKLSGWSGIEVLRILQADGRDIPCILVTGSVGEEIAAKCIKQGATDYILKDRPTRLPFAIKSALEEKSQREKRKDAERSRNRLASIVESSLDAIIGASVDGNILNWNPGAANMFGYSADEVYATPLLSLFSEESEAAGTTGNVLNAGNTIQRYEAKGTKKSGQVMDLAVTISPIWNSDGTAAGSSAIVRDVTEDKRQQRELLTTQKLEAIGQLAGGVAHDFNNLLTVINGYARMLHRKGSADPAKLDAILQAGERGQKLTKQLLVFSRKQITQFKPLNLNSLVLGFLDMLRPLIGADIELRTILAPDLASVLADSGQMEQVIMNLVVNARDAMPEGGTITIETLNLSGREATDESGTVALSVTDTGVGMSMEVQNRIFEPFFTTKEVGRGTGLGLSTSCGIVARCKGQLLVDSTLGIGTTFTIQLPACADASVEPVPLSTYGEISAKPVSGTILLAEDDPTVRGFVLAVLQDRGYHVLAAENGSKALELCTNYSGPIHALVSDVVMPELNGRALAERARLMRPDMKVLFVSGYIDQGLKDEDISNPSYAFLEKPFSGEALLKIVGDFCADVSKPAS